MPDDWSDWLQAAGTKSDLQLEIEAEVPASYGGTAEKRVAARVEIKRQDLEAAENLATKQLAIAKQQAKPRNRQLGRHGVVSLLH